MVSKSPERGFAYWPAIRATLVTGQEPAKVSTMAICKITLKVSRIFGAVKSWNDSAQSPPCNRKPLPWQTLAKCFSKLRISSAKTKGGNDFNCASTAWSWAISWYSGCCWAGYLRQLLALQAVLLAIMTYLQSLQH